MGHQARFPCEAVPEISTKRARPGERPHPVPENDPNRAQTHINQRPMPGKVLYYCKLFVIRSRNISVCIYNIIVTGGFGLENHGFGGGDSSLVLRMTTGAQNDKGTGDYMRLWPGMGY